MAAVMSLISALEDLAAQTKDQDSKPLIVSGNRHYFSVGADLNEIVRLSAVDALAFAKTGQQLVNLIRHFPAPVYAAISGYCMGGGLDLALSCDFRICSANAVFGHRGAALGVMTGWGGTQLLSNIVGRGRALPLFVAAEKLEAAAALEIGLVTEITTEPLERCMELIRRSEDKGSGPDMSRRGRSFQQYFRCSNRF